MGISISLTLDEMLPSLVIPLGTERSDIACCSATVGLLR
ncbi:unnamed protein product [Phyllotreta striolata]|uniref:Uncharacterized protein n=1 Tax=Phyllotreta striolata TaxID=444603 RepID=A0A9N9TNJ1_PHYSR|nr:unnamed protein product [Phyllotreta striolata]